ncbi:MULTISPECIES: TlpA family protein disulfide reductase [unclassified Colwellia]|uniref:TlpA family protein disulfide reductase n=1 Tax=unclassified Colwellia TaxID=196834 RepID=UPI0015F65C95|nr:MULTISPECIES: TlpA disulfide reductase family protein [unclassified Colwellia]MBA6233601.1 TlpA family protein disulfide reductase [Colwellia sp. MB02u-7]MBA6238161.1 TlpA family protein disulfide reductase [Colwellia sp. MB02u-11]MBA6255075.1 TlpA family protein disulfide reductase [Colwellia sp. MB3u-28]MBA6258974.1 TlpA family protein disulfide reductase [Colwellia sp. MB3u-41]MBA6299702.1 TlpA family protein disulfide reductase [Colwellia sp. MB3u-22]
MNIHLIEHPCKTAPSVAQKLQFVSLLTLTFFLFLSAAQAQSVAKISAKTQLDRLIAQHRGEVIYVDFWASWCGPCRKSFPWMNKMQREHQSKGFTVVSINLDAEQALAKEFLQDNSANFAVVYDPKGDLARFFKIQGMPSSLIINKEGEIKYAHSGFFTAKVSQYEQEIQQLLAL